MIARLCNFFVANVETIENSRAAVESELQTLKSTSSSSTSESQALHSRIASLETSNSDALALLGSKTAAHDSLAEELATQQQRIVALRREVSELEEKNQTLENASMAAKFREQSLQQEVELLKKNNDWNEEELKRRSTEHTKLRKEKGAQVAELQRSLEDATQTAEGLRSTESKLRSHITEVEHKLEDAIEQINVKTEDAVKTEQSFRAERDSALRLAELQKKSAETARARQQDLERSADQLREDAAVEIGNLQADINAERTEKEASERRVAELEAQVETLQTELATAQQTTAAPSTPRRGVNGFSTPGRSGSPGVFASPGGSRLKSGLSATQAYAQYTKVKAELDVEKRRSEELSRNLDEMLQELEVRSPEIEEIRLENTRLKAEVEEVADMVQQANTDRDAARKAARKWEGTAQGLSKEADLLRQQLRDLSAQLKMVLYELQSREEGLEALSDADRIQLEQLARGELDDGALDGMSPTGKFISQHLVIFRNVQELQNQNVQLRHITRKLGEEMEGEEARAKRNQQEEDLRELEDLRTRLTEYQDSIQSLTARSESYIQERDMFRRMLAHRGQLPMDADLTATFGQSTATMPATPARGQSVEPSQDSRALADYVKLVKEMQQHFDSYREEAATDHSALKQQADRLSKDKSDLQGEIARTSSQLTLAHERYNMLQSNYNMLKSENGELQKRTQSLSEIATRQDIKTQQVAEELVEARSLADSMRNETANLKAERELWKNIENRLTEDNRSLVDERSRLNKMVSDLQSLQNEREHADSESRRKLQSRIETLESEYSAAKRRLDEEVDQSRKAALRREYEQEQNRTRIEDLLKGSSNAKEELVAVKTQRDQLQARVDEMKIELRNAEEKAQALQPRPSTRPNNSAEMDENALTREQEMGIEIADLSRDLQLKQSELQQAEEQIEEYKAIAQSAEEALESNTETTEQYRQTTDQELAEKDAKIKDLETRVEEISTELATTNAELSEIRSKFEESTTRMNDQKAMFEADLSRLRDESERLAETARLHQLDLKSQAEISQQAQQHYEEELVKSGEMAKTLQKIRSEYNELKTEVAGYRTEAEAAKATLSQSEDSWSETRNRYEQEITDLKNRREDVLAQNRRLHQQLEDLSSQIAALKQTRTANGDDEEQAGSVEAGSDNLQEIIRYLRQEKEIVDMQYELSIQESKRLKQQLDHTTAQLDQTREKLEQDRLSQNDREQNAANHSKLIQTINDLNLFRESNTSLRNEARSAQEQLATKTKEVQELVLKLEPLQTRLREVEHDLESKEGEVKLLQEDRDRWQKRTQDIMQKYDRVDPAELEALKTQITDLQAEKERLLADHQPLQEQIDAIPEKIRFAQEESARNWEERRTKLIEQSKAKVREVNTAIKEKSLQLEAATVEQARLTQELASVKDELEKTKAGRGQASGQASNKPVASEDAAEDGQIDETSRVGLTAEAQTELELRVSNAEGRANGEASRAASLQQEVIALQTRVQDLEAQIVSATQQIPETLLTFRQAGRQQNLEASNAQVSALQNTPQSIEPPQNTEDIERLQAELASVQDQLRSQTDLAATINTITTDGSKPVAAQVAERVEQIRSDLKSEHDEAVRKSEETYQRRADNMKKQLSAKLSEGKQKFREEVKQEHESAMEQLRSEHEQELASLRSQAPEASSSVAPPAASTPAAHSTDGKPQEPWKPSQAEIKELISTDPGVKNLLARNVQQKIDQQKEEWTAQLKQEEEKIWSAKLEEAKKEADATKEKAIAAAREMESKRMSVKLNMTDTKAKNAIAKIEVVEKAATETPERPVGEVWAIAKDTKPTIVARPAPPQATATAPKVPATPQPQQQVRRPSQSATAPIQQPGVSQPQAGQTSAAPQVNQNLFGNQGQGPQVPSGFGQPSVPAGRGIPANPFTGQTGIQQPRQSSGTLTSQTPNAPGQSTQQPGGGLRGGSIPQPASGTGPAALRGIMGSNQTGQPGPQNTGIPRPGVGRGGQGRGRGIPQPTQNHQNQQQGSSGLPRGGGQQNRGRGGGRGGQNVQTSGLPQQQGDRASSNNGQNSPGGRGGMNAGAKQFVPGGPQAAGFKRPHDGDGGNGVDKKHKGGAE
jgi:nucleoprotein TPR